MTHTVCWSMLKHEEIESKMLYELQEEMESLRVCEVQPVKPTHPGGDTGYGRHVCYGVWKP